MKSWLPKWNRPSQAANATLWMASPSAARKTGAARVTTVNQETVRYLEIFFGGLCVFLFLLSVAGAWKGEASWRSALLIFIFIAVNLSLYHLALRSPHPLRVVALHTALGWILCPIVYISVDGALVPWWPGYVVMGLSGAILWGLILPKPLWARLVLLFYLLNMAAATGLRPPPPDSRGV